MGPTGSGGAGRQPATPAADRVPRARRAALPAAPAGVRTLRGRRAALVLTAVLLATALPLTACAAGANPDAGAGPDAAGFWLGLWHGVISPVTFLVSLFSDTVGIYEVRNSGAWYDFGFLLGALLAFSGPAGGGAARRARR